MTPNIEQLRKRLTGLVARRAGFAIALQGSAGIGKTFTVREVFNGTDSNRTDSNRTDSNRTDSNRTDSNGTVCKTFSHRAITPVAELVRGLPKPKKLAAWATRELENPEPSLEALASLLIALAPIAIHLEDLHECTPDQVSVWQELARAITQSKGVGLIVTTRTAAPEGFETMRLEPLSGLASEQMLEAEISAKLPGEASNWIHARAAGNPLFALEFFRFLARRGFVWSDGQCWHWRTPERDLLPASVEAMIERSILEACSDQNTRTVLEVRAYLESKLPNLKLEPEVLAKIAGLEKQTLELSERKLRTGGVMNETGFAHPLFREVPTKSITTQTTKDFARHAISWLHDQPALACRFLKDARLDNSQTRALLESAIAQAERSGQMRLAYDLTITVLDLNLHDPTEQCRLGLRLARYSLSKAAALFDRIDPQSNDDIYGWASILAQLGRLRDAQDLLQSLDASERQQTRWYEHQLLVHGLANDHPGAIAIWDQHQTSMGRESTFLLTVANSLTMVSRMQEASETLEVALDAANSDAVLADVLIVKGQLLAYLGDFLQAHACGTQAFGIYEQLGDTSGLAITNYGLGILVYYNGRLDIAEQHFSTAKELFLEIGNPTRYIQSLTMLCATQTELGQYEQSERGLLEAEEQLPNDTPSEVLIEIYNNLSFLYRGWDISYGPILALRYSRKALAMARQLNNPRLITSSLYQASKSETLTGHPEEGLRLAEETLDLAGQLKYAAIIGYAHHARYQALKNINRIDEAMKSLEDGEAMCRSQNSLADADFYALEIQCLQNNWPEARALLAQLQQKNQIHFSNHAVRLYPQLVSQAQIPTKIEIAPELQVLGTMRITHNTTTEVIRGQKRKALLATLLEARILGRFEVKTLELLECVYADSYENDGLAALKQNVFKIRSTFGQNAISTTANGYALGAISSDAERFLKQSQTQLWRGPYLQDAALEASDVVSEILTQALQVAANSQLESNPTEAARTGRILLEADPYNLPALQLTCHALRSLENHRSLTRTYAESREKLLEVGENLPDRWQDFLSEPTENPKLI